MTNRVNTGRSGKGITAVTYFEEGQYLSLCPELDIISSGHTPDTAVSNLKLAVRHFLATACRHEIRQRLESSSMITSLEPRFG
jgi:hypothetical protein